MDDEVAGCQSDHVLQPGEAQGVASGQCREGRDDFQPCEDVDQRVELVVQWRGDMGDARSRPWFIDLGERRGE